MEFTLDEDAELAMINTATDAYVKRAVRGCVKMLGCRLMYPLCELMC